MKKSVWGPITWKLLHCIAIKIKDEHFDDQRVKILEVITKICAHLPCPYCASHASSLIAKHKMHSIQKKEHLVNFLYSMHNDVNKRLRKPIFEREKLIQYENENFRDALIKYFEMNQSASYSEKMMLYSFHRREFLILFHKYFTENIQKFNK